MKGGEKVKVKRTLTIEKEVYDRVEEYADKNGISVSGAFSVLAMQKLDEIDALKQAHEMQSMFERMSALLDSPEQMQMFTSMYNTAAK